MVRTNQGGSILGFLIVGSVLALLLVGGAYAVRHQLATTSDKDTESIVTQNSAGESDDTNKEADAPKDDKAASDKDDEQAGGATTLPGATDDDGAEDTADNPPVTDLPETGPADVLLSTLLIGSTVGAAIAYKRSRAVAASL